jgi:hypothetical protein
MKLVLPNLFMTRSEPGWHQARGFVPCKGLGYNTWRAVRHSKNSGELVGGIEAEAHVDLADGALESLQKADATKTAQIKEMQTSIASLKKNVVRSAEREAAWLLPNTATQMLCRPVEVIRERYQELLQTNEGALRALAQAEGYESAEQFVSALPGLVRNGPARSARSEMASTILDAAFRPKILSSTFARCHRAPAPRVYDHARRRAVCTVGGCVANESLLRYFPARTLGL